MPKSYSTIEQKREHSLAQIKRTEAAIGPNAGFRPVPKNMAAGPCDACLKFARKVYRSNKATLMPLDRCLHPDQCVGHFRLETGL